MSVDIKKMNVDERDIFG